MPISQVLWKEFKSQKKERIKVWKDTKAELKALEDLEWAIQEAEDEWIGDNNTIEEADIFDPFDQNLIRVLKPNLHPAKKRKSIAERKQRCAAAQHNTYLCLILFSKAGDQAKQIANHLFPSNEAVVPGDH